MMGSQGFELAFESCDANRSVLARLMGRYRRSTRVRKRGRPRWRKWISTHVAPPWPAWLRLLPLPLAPWIP